MRIPLNFVLFAAEMLSKTNATTAERYLNQLTVLPAGQKLERTQKYARDAENGISHPFVLGAVIMMPYIR